MEKLMQYVWQHRLWPITDSVTVDGRRVRVLDPGLLNTDAGPDFFNAKIQIGDEMWVGNVEIHVRASDWKRHGHHNDRSYDTVVLHVVYYNDTQVTRPDGSFIPQMVMDCAYDFSDRYKELVFNNRSEPACAEEIKALPSIYISDWLTTLGLERIHTKAERVAELARHNNNDWNAAIYITLARALGFGTNAEPFEHLAISTPYRVLGRYTDDADIMEAILFGQSGLLDGIDSENSMYIQRLKRDYDFYATKHNLKRAPLEWKMSRMRPDNFPHRRIATLAQLLRKWNLIGNILATKDIESAREMFDVPLMGFWAGQYNFTSPRVSVKGHALSRTSIDSIIINVVCPVLVSYGQYSGDESLCERAIDMLSSLKAEQNRLVEPFRSVGIELKDAFTSQALIHLKKEYCNTRKCLYCRFGHRFLSQKVKRR